TRRVVLRPITNTSQFVRVPAWSSATNYLAGDLVYTYPQYWVAGFDNTAQQPGIVPADHDLYWDSYFGSFVADVWSDSGYFDGELVYKTPGDGTYTVY